VRSCGMFAPDPRLMRHRGLKGEHTMESVRLDDLAAALADEVGMPVSQALATLVAWTEAA
jgi:hypothetical protein